MKIRNIILCLGTVLMLNGCSWFTDTNTPEGYVKHCIRLMDKQALYAEGEAWETMKQQTLKQASQISSLEEAHSLIEEALKVSGGKHSTLIAPETRKSESVKEKAPEVKVLDEDILFIELPPHTMTSIVSDSLYIFTVFNFLKAHQDAKGVIIDLRNNSGGNMYPMLAAVSPLIPDGIFIRFKGRSSNQPISLEYVEKSEGVSSQKFKMPDTLPITLLTNEWTASSGEATLLAFRGLKNARTFGSPTAGYASANIPFQLSDGYTMVLTTSQDVARTGEVFCDDPIAPDVATETPLEDAVNWIIMNYK